MSMRRTHHQFFAVAFSVLLFVTCFSVTVGAIEEDRTCPKDQLIAQRSKRWILSYPINGGLAKMVLGCMLPIRFHHPLPRSLNLLNNLQAVYRILPATIFPRPETIFKNRANEQYTDQSRSQFYAVVEKMLQRWNRNGRSCLLRTICEVAETPLRHNGLVGALFDVVFTPYETDQLDKDYLMAKKYGANGVDCMRVYSDCPLGHGLLDTISAIQF
ncbi:uncharacterized protein LOC126572204 [Anopheles aquasalis]|uniref:uncharacterized protein LOC126572204 n=1 Tax=Anopheles aquasalis TaxID=42839 RepID=UPI00215A85E3|nr:uncharacterized protein LOC126572204 [Anopheles aquasalis]